MSALRWIVGLGRSGRGRFVLAVLLGALASGAAIGLAGTAAWLISRASQHPPVLYLMVAIVAVRAFGLGRGVLRYGERLTGHDATFRTLADLRVATVERLERVLPIRSTGPTPPMATGELVARFVDDIDGLQDLWVRVLLPYAAAAFVGAATVALIGILVPAAGIVLAASLAVAAVLAPVVSAHTARRAGARLTPLRADYRSGVLDLLDGATELAVYGALADRLAHLERLDVAMTRSEARSAAAAGAGAAVATLAAGGAMWAGLWFGAAAVDTRTLASVSLAVVVLVPLAAHEIFAGLASGAHQLPALVGAATRVRDVFEQPDAVHEPTSPAAPPIGPYGLLLRLVDPTAGTIELTGSTGSADLSHLTGDDVRTIIGWCAQDAYIFDSTIEANLRLARPDATTDDVHDALRRAGLADWVAGLPRGLATMVGEHGDHLSGGQRQRLALARVLLANRPVVIFDEPTEHLDEPVAAALAADLLDAVAGTTILVVTHRPELFEDVDQVVTLAGGRCTPAPAVA